MERVLLLKAWSPHISEGALTGKGAHTGKGPIKEKEPTKVGGSLGVFGGSLSGLHSCVVPNSALRNFTSTLVTPSSARLALNTPQSVTNLCATSVHFDNC